MIIPEYQLYGDSYDEFIDRNILELSVLMLNNLRFCYNNKLDERDAFILSHDDVDGNKKYVFKVKLASYEKILNKVITAFEKNDTFEECIECIKLRNDIKNTMNI